MKPSRRYLVLVHVAAAGAALIILAPFAWLLISSVSTPADLLARPLRWIPPDLTLDRYRQIFGGEGGAAGEFRRALVNSTVVAAGTVVVSLTVGIFGAYALARLRFRGRRLTLRLFLATYMLPPIAIIIPIYLIMSQLGLLDSKLGLILVYCSFVTPFVLWIMSNYLMSLPAELEDAARVDGCSRIGALFRVMLPIARPGLFATTMFGFLLAWDEFLYALILTSTPNAKTVPVAIAEFTGRHSVDFGLIAAGGVLASVPPVLLAIAFQKYVVSGLTSGAVKG
jgi:multiple sugar transport system permease protein